MPSFPLDDHTHPWFIDQDDGTLIHFFLADNTIKFEQNVTLDECDAFTAAVALDFVDPLPSDFSFASGSVSRFDDRLSLFIEEFTPSRVGEPTILAEQDQGLPVETFITRYDFINVASLGTSNGTPTQIFTAATTDIELPTKGTPLIFVNGTAFIKIDNIQTAGPNDNVFEYNEITGDVLFGNDVNGAIPESGQEIILKITIRNGGGQWKFAGLVNGPKDEINIGNVKSVKDQVLYSQAKISMASQSGFLTMVTTLGGAILKNFISVGGTPTQTLQSAGFHLAFGGQAIGSGGTLTDFNTSAFGIVNPLPKAVSGSVRQVVNTGVVYPSIRTTVEDTSDFKATVGAVGLVGVAGGTSSLDTWLAVTSGAGNPPAYTEDFVESGVVTSPKQYSDFVKISPIVAVVYSHPSGPIDTTKINLFGFRTTLPITRIPIFAPDYESKLVQMGHIVGTFDNPIDTTSDLTTRNHDSGQTSVTAGAYFTSVDFDTADIDDELIMKYECRLTDERKAVLTHYGSPIPPDFICTWTATLNTLGDFCVGFTLLPLGDCP